MIVRISTGQFDPSQHQEIALMLIEVGPVLVPAIRALPGCRHYYAGIEVSSSTIVNVSVWDTLEVSRQS
jgi:hypothetical protein